MLPTVQYSQLKIVISIVVYLNMYNLPLVMSHCVSLGFS